MSSITKRIKKNIKHNYTVSVIFECPNCGYDKKISQSLFKSLPQDTLNDNEIFKCPNCKIKMGPTKVVADAE